MCYAKFQPVKESSNRARQKRFTKFSWWAIMKAFCLWKRNLLVTTLRDRGSLLFLLGERETRGTSARNRTILWSRRHPRPGTNKIKNQLLTSLKRVFEFAHGRRALRSLPRVLLRLNSARYHYLPNVTINRAFKNDASNPMQKRNHFSAWKALNHFGISSNSFKLRSNVFKPRAKKNMTKSSINNR